MAPVQGAGFAPARLFCFLAPPSDTWGGGLPSPLEDREQMDEDTFVFSTQTHQAEQPG